MAKGGTAMKKLISVAIVLLALAGIFLPTGQVMGWSSLPPANLMAK